MIRKELKKKELELGFIQIPVNGRTELFGSIFAPHETKLNDLPAKVDKKGRIWCREFLKSKFPVNTEVIISKNENGFKITINGQNEGSDILEKQHAVENQKLRALTDVTVTSSMPVLSTFSIAPESSHRVLEGDCIKFLNEGKVGKTHLTFFDPPYLQGKKYRFFDDNQSDEKYWEWVEAVAEGVYQTTAEGGALYFMHREKNVERILQIIRKTEWNFQNLIIWKKKTSAVPIETRFSKQYQIIVYAIKGKRPRVFNKVRIDPPPLPWHKWQHENGVFLTDVWDDIRELTSGYFAGDEAFRNHEGKRMHVQQTPVALLLRIILSSTMPGDVIFDPTAGTGTASVVAKQLNRNSVGIEIDPINVELIRKRLTTLRPSDDVSSYFDYYKFTPNLNKIWQRDTSTIKQKELL